ncbi:MAG: helix-turn-helix transcriptional regulator [Clostridia bacterium]|nr:helix-turn-helix transcriptional regulator [Clostridia bacterium]
MGKVGAEWFFRQVAEGDAALDSESIERLAGQLEIPIGKNTYFCVAVRFADAQIPLKDAAFPKKLLNTCKLAVKEQGEDAYCYSSSYLNVIAVIADIGTGRDKVAQRLHQAVSRRLKLPVQIGVGRSFAAEKLSYSRVEALESLNFIAEDEGVAYIDDVYTVSSVTARKTERDKRRIVEQFRSGQFTAMQESLIQMAECIREESPVREDRPYPTSIRRTVVEVLAEMMHISADNGVNAETVLGNQDPYRHVFELDDTPLIIQWCCDVAQKLYQSMMEQRQKTDSHLLVAARKYVREHVYDADLSLSVVSREIGMSPSYFSAFFIREMGVGFSEYITSMRVEKAKELLHNSVKKINVIAQDCGFMSASYFINVFRRQVGCSPGEYRKQK